MKPFHVVNAEAMEIVMCPLVKWRQWLTNQR